jgi:hypothetical protein
MKKQPKQPVVPRLSRDVVTNWVQYCVASWEKEKMERSVFLRDPKDENLQEIKQIFMDNGWEVKGQNLPIENEWIAVKRTRTI